MNEEYGILFVHYEDHLQESSFGGRTPDEEFLIRARERIRRTSPAHDLLGFLRLHAVLRDVVLGIVRLLFGLMARSAAPVFSSFWRTAFQVFPPSFERKTPRSLFGP